MSLHIFKKYISITRPGNVTFFWEVLLGILYALEFNAAEIIRIDLTRLLTIFISFQLLYASIYIFNDLIDCRKDKIDPVKSKRSIASGEIKPLGAFIFASILLFFALLISYNYLFMLFIFELAFLTYNLIYSLILKKIPYLDSFFNSITHLGRFYMGILLFHGDPTIISILFITTFSTSASITKRAYELENRINSRPVLKYYSVKIIRIIQMLAGFILLLLLVLSKNKIDLYLAFTFSVIYFAILIPYLTNLKFRKRFEEIFFSY